MDIRIKTIPHSEQRYPTIGDWQFLPSGELLITVSALGNENYEALIAVHELVEALLCRNEGVTQQSVDRFDQQFKGDGEPGDVINAPYYLQHQLATDIERTLSIYLNVDWEEYDQKVEEVYDGK